MKILSIRQPWAWAIICGGKDIENRTWKTNFRGQFLVHASKTFDIEGWQWIKKNENLLRTQQSVHELPDYTNFPKGGIIGSVELVNCVTSYGSPWFSGPYGFVLKNPQPLLFQPCNGHLKFFEVR